MTTTEWADEVVGGVLTAGPERLSAAGRLGIPQVVSVGGRMHSLEDMTRFVEVFLVTPFSGDERHVRRIGQIGDYERTRELPALPASAQPSAQSSTQSSAQGRDA